MINLIDRDMIKIPLGHFAVSSHYSKDHLWKDRGNRFTDYIKRKDDKNEKYEKILALMLCFLCIALTACTGASNPSSESNQEAKQHEAKDTDKPTLEKERYVTIASTQSDIGYGR